MKTSWEKTKGKRSDYCGVYPKRVELGRHYGSGQTDNAGSCTHQEFLKGRFQAAIKETFGAKVLEQVIAAVKGIRKQPDVAKMLQREREQLRNWLSVPIEPQLSQMVLDADEDGYRDNYAKGRDRSTVVNLTETVKLFAKRNPQKSYLQKSDGIKVPAPIYSAPMIGYAGLVYCASIHLTVYDTDANCVFDTQSLKHSHGIGGDLRISNILRKGDQMIASYQNPFFIEDPSFPDVLGRSGFLLLGPVPGIVGRFPSD